MQSPAFWAVICVHNKQVRYKESKSRVCLTFAWVRSIIQKRGLRKVDHWLYWAGWNRDYILSSDLTALTCRSCIDPFLSSMTHVCKSYIVVKLNRGFCILLMSTFVSFAVSFKWYCPKKALRNPHSSDCSVKSHSSCQSFWMRLWTAGFTSKLFHFFCALLPFDPISSCTILPFFSHRHPAFLPQHGGEVLMGVERR